jgi:L-fuculose-phosphate aldolase
MPATPDPRYGRQGWQLIRTGRRLGQSGLIAGAEGNLSSLTAYDSLLITRAGARKDELQPTDLLVLSIDGTLIRGDGPPSTELALHLAAYEMCSEARAVIHAHPIAATAFAAAEQVPDWRALAESIALLGEVRLVPYAHPGSSDLATSLRASIDGSRVLLLAHHGALTVGASLEQALQRMELLERLCAIHCAAIAIGGLKHLPEEEQRRLLE